MDFMVTKDTIKVVLVPVFTNYIHTTIDFPPKEISMWFFIYVTSDLYRVSVGFSTTILHLFLLHLFSMTFLRYPFMHDNKKYVQEVSYGY